MLLFPEPCVDVHVVVLVFPVRRVQWPLAPRVLHRRKRTIRIPWSSVGALSGSLAFALARGCFAFPLRLLRLRGEVKCHRLLRATGIPIFFFIFLKDRTGGEVEVKVKVKVAVGMGMEVILMRKVMGMGGMTVVWL